MAGLREGMFKMALSRSGLIAGKPNPVRAVATCESKLLALESSCGWEKKLEISCFPLAFDLEAVDNLVR